MKAKKTFVLLAMVLTAAMAIFVNLPVSGGSEAGSNLNRDEDPVVIKETYDRTHALKVIEAAIQDYDETFALVG